MGVMPQNSQLVQAGGQQPDITAIKLHMLNMALQAKKVRAFVTVANDGAQIRCFRVHLDVGEEPEKIERLAGALASSAGVGSARVSRAADGTLYIELPKPPEERRILSGEFVDRQPVPSPLHIPVGQSVIGPMLYWHLADPNQAHALIAGATGSGKTKLTHWTLFRALRQNPPDRLRFIAFDPKARELDEFSQSAHLLHPVATEPKDIKGLLLWLDEEVQRRQRMRTYPYRILVVVDEAKEISLRFRKAKEIFSSVAGGARSLDINLLLTTQHPTADVFGQTLPNVPLRMIGLVAAQNLSYMATGRSKMQANRLLGRGDFIYLPPGDNDNRMQVPYMQGPLYQRIVRAAQVPSLEIPSDLEIADRDVDPRGGHTRRDLDEDDMTRIQRDIAAGVSPDTLKKKYGIGWTRAKRLYDSYWANRVM